VIAAPRFTKSERALLFLHPHADGTYRISQFMLGAFHEVRAGEYRLALRDLSEARPVPLQAQEAETGPERPRDLERFADWLADRASGRQRETDYTVDDGSLGSAAVAPFTLLDDAGVPARWFTFDTQGSVPWQADFNGQSGMNEGGFSQFQQALAAWTNEPSTPISLQYTGTTTATGGLLNGDGVNAILFDDPNGELSGSFDCSSGGIIAIGGWWSTGATGTFGGTQFNRIVEGDVVTQDGVGCLLGRHGGADGAETFTHEVGHTLGLGHSCGDGASGTCSPGSDKDQAVMRAIIHADGRGASLGNDDRAGIRFLYELALPSLTVNDTSVVEGNSGNVNAVFTVTLSSASSQTVTVAYTTANGTAVAGGDYVAVSGTLTFPAGATMQSVAVPVVGDGLVERDETFVIDLSNPANATLSRARGTGTITNDDVPALSIADVSLPEANAGVTNVSFAVSLSQASFQTVTVSYATADGTAVAGNDYFPASGTLTFAPGVTAGVVSVAVFGDRVLESNETFVVNLTGPVNATLSKAQGTGTVIDDDPAGLSIADVALKEPPSGTAAAIFIVTLSPVNPSQTVTVHYATADGSATAGSDYVSTSGTLTFAPGTATQVFGVSVIGDLAPEASESFVVNLSAATNAAIAYGQAVGTIIDSRGAGDFDGDGHGDILWRNVGGPDTGALFVWLMNGRNVAGASYLQPITADWVIRSVADFNGDGKADILWRQAGTGSLFVWIMDGPRVIGAGYTNAQADERWQVQGVGDLNGDGKADLVWRNVGGPDTGALFLWLMDGTTVIGATYLDPIGTDWQIQRLGDFNGDGKADILWRYMNAAAPDAGKLYIWMMDGPTVASGTGYTNSQADFRWQVQGVGDLNGDGKSDIVWRNVGGPDTGALFLWLMNGASIVLPTYLDPIGTDWSILGTMDFNGDGKSDILWRNVNASAADALNLYIWMMSGPAVVAGTGYTTSQASNAWQVMNP
jgi:hypothetical protein